jgi:2-dehydro-3-deoxygalactonokinase
MGDASFVAGDWGTSHLRLFLCNAQGVALARSHGPGAAAVSGNFASVFDSLLTEWEQRHGVLPAVLCGMVGSSIGWMQAPYVPCPANPEQIADACVQLRSGGVHIVPGLSCRNRLNAPDFLRGEETQILGALNLVAALHQGRWLLCLPGTHTKWVVLEDGSVREFFTAPTGELFDLLRNHSVLVPNDKRLEPATDGEAFKEGLVQFNEFPQAQLLHRLFECRSRQLSGQLAPQKVTAFLSGLLIASDVSGALQLLSSMIAAGNVYLIGSPQLTQLYAAALTFYGCDSSRVDGVAASLAGLAHVRWRLVEQGLAHAV